MGEISKNPVNWAPAIYAGHPVVSAISVLTQKHFFGGDTDDLKQVRKATQDRPKPILRKDFIFSEYEVFFSRWIGADAILLMANVVDDKKKFKTYHDLAVSLGMDVLCEVHEESEIGLLPDSVKICGVNSRRFKGVKQKQKANTGVFSGLRDILFPNSENKRDTRTDLTTFALFDKLVSQLPSDCIKVAESGISAGNVRDVLERYPYNSALIGTSLLQSGQDMPAMLDKIQAESESALGKASVSTVNTEHSFA
jgi:indole-3-glycerol phosphate synthase